MNKNLFFSILLSGGLGAQTYSNTTAVAIPDNNLVTGATSTINVPLTETINDPSKVTVKLDLSHTWSGDVVVALVPPGGATTGAIALLKRIGSTTATGVGLSADFVAGNVLSFNSTSTTAVAASGTIIPAGTYAPTGSSVSNPTAYSTANLSTLFTNLAVNGDWTVQLFDGALSDTGTLNNWQIVFESGTFLGVNASIVSTPGLSVLGNPFKESLNLKLNASAKNVDFAIYSMHGKKVYTYQQSSTKNTGGDIKIPTEQWSSGVYILAPIVNGEKQMSIKLIKN